MTTSCTIILILFGIKFLKIEIITFEAPITNTTDNVITNAGFNWTVIAKAEQIPKTWTVIGLLSSSGSLNRALFFFENNS